MNNNKNLTVNELFELAVQNHKNNNLQDAQNYYQKVLEIDPNHVNAHNNLGAIFNTLGDYQKAKDCYEKAIEIDPNSSEAYYNLGTVLKELGEIQKAKECYEKAIQLNPILSDAHNNLGVVFLELEEIHKARECYEKAIQLNPTYVNAYYNLGIVFSQLGENQKAIDCNKKAIEIDPNFHNAWNNIFLPLQAIKLQVSSIEDHLPVLNEQITSKYTKISKSILSYRLNQGSPSSDSSLDEVLSILSSADNLFIKNPKVPSHELITKPTPPKKIAALIHFGRSGSGLLHSLIDGHPEVSTLPSIYFSEFFHHVIWEKIITGGWEEMAENFTKTYAVLFDASSDVKVLSKSFQFINNAGQLDGMTTVGTERNEVLSVDKKVFIKELKRLMNYHHQLDALAFFKLVHCAYDSTLHDKNEKKLIFYHIHDRPDDYAQLNFLRLAPNTSWLMMVRDPVQSCESWIRKNFQESDYQQIVYRIFSMLFDVDQTVFRNKSSIGVKLEDLKENPKKTIQALCGWLGIQEKDSLYEMTAQGKKWWGDPTSNAKDGMNPFGKSSINRKLGSIFSKNDQFILQTLYYPFRVRFDYVEENLEQFKNDLQAIRPMLDLMFDFEKKIVQNKKIDTEIFMKSCYYLFLRSGMLERWSTLNKFHTYPNMLTALKIN